MSMKIRRNLISKSSGLPIKGLVVTAKNSVTLGVTSLPEISPNTGTYESTQVSHGTYKIFAGDTDTLDEVTVEDGRFTVGLRSPLLDRSFTDSIRLSSFIDDDADFADHVAVYNAITMASDIGCSLKFDVDSSFTGAISVTGDLFIDLCGRHISLEGVITGGTVCVRNGSIYIGDSGKFVAYNDSLIKVLAFFCVQFSGNVEHQVTAQPVATYIECEGIDSMYGSTESHFIGSYPFGTPEGLVLTNYKSDTGSKRQLDLDAFISTYTGGSYVSQPALITDALAWLLTGDRKKSIDATIAVYAGSINPKSVCRFADNPSLNEIGIKQFIEVQGSVNSDGIAVYKYMRGRIVGRYQRVNGMTGFLSSGSWQNNNTAQNQVDAGRANINNSDGFLTSGIIWSPISQPSIPECFKYGGIVVDRNGNTVKKGSMPLSYKVRAYSVNPTTGQTEILYAEKWLPILSDPGKPSVWTYTMPITCHHMSGSTRTELDQDEQVIVDFCFTNSIVKNIDAKEWWSV